MSRLNYRLLVDVYLDFHPQDTFFNHHLFEQHLSGRVIQHVCERVSQLFIGFNDATIVEVDAWDIHGEDLGFELVILCGQAEVETAFHFGAIRLQLGSHEADVAIMQFDAGCAVQHRLAMISEVNAIVLRVNTIRSVKRAI